MKKGIDINHIISLYKEGKNLAEISEIVGCCTVNITRRLKKVGIKFKRDYSKVRHCRNNRTSIDINLFSILVGTGAYSGKTKYDFFLGI